MFWKYALPAIQLFNRKTEGNKADSPRTESSLLRPLSTALQTGSIPFFCSVSAQKKMRAAGCTPPPCQSRSPAYVQCVSQTPPQISGWTKPAPSALFRCPLRLSHLPVPPPQTPLRFARKSSLRKKSDRRPYVIFFAVITAYKNSTASE